MIEEAEIPDEILIPKEIREAVGNDTSRAAALLGKKGGTRLLEKHGRQHLSEIGKKGGNSTKKSHSSDYYRKIGALGGRKKKSIGKTDDVSNN